MAASDKQPPPPHATGAPDGTDSGLPPGVEPPELPEWRKPGGQLGQIHDAIEVMLGGVALAFFTAGDFYCYTVISDRTPLVARAWTDAAAKSPPVKAALLRLLEGGQWGQVIFATGSLVIPLLDHHGMWPFPNPWTILQATPADFDENAAAAAAAAAMGGWVAPQADPSDTAPDPGGAPDIAERQRRAAERRRQRQQFPTE